MNTLQKMSTLQQFKELLKIKYENTYYRKFFTDFETFCNNGKIKAHFKFNDYKFYIVIFPQHFDLAPDTIKNDMIEEIIQHIAKQKDIIDVLNYVDKNPVHRTILKNLLFRTVMSHKELDVLQKVELLNKKHDLKDIFLNAYWEEHIQQHVENRYRTFPFNDLTSEEIKVLKGLRKVL